MQPDGEPVSPDRLQKLQGKVRITTKYDWRDEGDEEVLPHFDDGVLIITRNIPSSANYLSLQVCFKNCLLDINPPSWDHV